MKSFEKFSKNIGPENECNLERESGIMKVLESTPEEEKEELEKFKEIFSSQEIFDAEREKTDEEIKIIETLNKLLPDFLKKYGGRYIEIKPDNFHFLDESKLSQEEKKFIGPQRPRAFYWLSEQGIFFIPGAQESKISRMHTLLHEMLEVHLYTAVSKIAGELHRRRGGIRFYVRKNKKTYLSFDELQDAILEELSIRFDEKYFSKIPWLSDELRLREEMRQKVSKARGMAVEIAYAKDLDGKHTEIAPWGMPEKRKELNELIDEIFKKNQEKFGDREDVFEVFVRASFTKKLSELSLLIEQTFGRGSFKKMVSKNTEELK